MLQVPSEMPSTQYQGCFVETPTMGLMVGAVGSVSECLSYCEDFGFRYAGLSGGVCYCGDTYDTTTQVSDAECDNDCTGSCGGIARTSVYLAGNHPSGGGYTFESNLYCDCHYDWYPSICGILPCTRMDFSNRVSSHASVKGCIAMCRSIGNRVSVDFWSTRSNQSFCFVMAYMILVCCVACG